MLLNLGSLTAQTKDGMWVLFWVTRVQFSEDLVMINNMKFPDYGHVRFVASKFLPFQVAAWFACPVAPSVALNGTREDNVSEVLCSRQRLILRSGLYSLP
jgi:hypothetical protein